MTLQFNKIILHNFGSYHHAEIDLANKGFCSVIGENHHVEDNAKSNGSGKSFIWSGICFALTGETIQGLSQKLKNIYTSDTDAYVSLDFSVDGDHYFITRIIAPRTDLKISKNGNDISGKGIRESEAILATMLPDVTRELIASTIIIGQGMPNKFSSFSPAGRKDLLEKLTKSDFMIEDVKERIKARRELLDDRIRELSDKIIIHATKIHTLNSSLQPLQEAVANAVRPDFDREILEATDRYNEHIKNADTAKVKIKEQESTTETLNKQLLDTTAEKAKKTQELLEAYTKATSEQKATKTTLETQIRTIDNELARMRANPGVCPTCGQKLPNAEHILKEKEERETKKASLTESLAHIKDELVKADEINTKYSNDIKAASDSTIADLTTRLSEVKLETRKLKDDEADFGHYADIEKQKISDLTYKKNTWDADIATKKSNIESISNQISSSNAELTTAENAKLELENHLGRVKNLDTLASRDFRGFILQGIIAYLDKKAKDYAEIVFKHRNLNIYLDKNNLNITFTDKIFDNLSGGEKQKVDLIIQFAIRDLLITYLSTSANILVLDEITDFVDKEGCYAIMNLINSELKNIESVFIISHHSEELDIPIDSELKVIKGEDGISRII